MTELIRRCNGQALLLGKWVWSGGLVVFLYGLALVISYAIGSRVQDVTVFGPTKPSFPMSMVATSAGALFLGTGTAIIRIARSFGAGSAPRPSSSACSDSR